MKGARSDCLLACFEHLVSQTQDGVPGLDQLQVAKRPKVYGIGRLFFFQSITSELFNYW